MKTILITGSNGLLGQKLITLYKDQKDIRLVATSRGANRYPYPQGYEYHALDITHEDEINTICNAIKPHCIINTAAMTNVDACEEDQEGCISLNINAVKYLVKAANQFKTHFIHLSTDFIFDGEAGPYSEEDSPNPLSFYGWSKLEAEKHIRITATHWAIARTILVYGIVHDMSRSNIVLWAKQALETGKPINVVNDQFRMPTLAEDLAMGCRLIEKSEAEGIFNISGRDMMSVVDIVKAVARFYKLDSGIIREVNSSTLNQKAKRPPKTGFDLSKSQTVLNYQAHSFEEGLAIMNAQIEV